MPSRLALLLVFFVCPSARSAGGGTITYTVNVSAGWNLLSLPVQVADGASGTVFPDAIVLRLFLSIRYHEPLSAFFCTVCDSHAVGAEYRGMLQDAIVSLLLFPSWFTGWIDVGRCALSLS